MPISAESSFNLNDISLPVGGNEIINLTDINIQFLNETRFGAYPVDGEDWQIGPVDIIRLDWSASLTLSEQIKSDLSFFGLFLNISHLTRQFLYLDQ